MLAGAPVQAGRMFGGKTVAPAPKWCFCARVCAGFSKVAPSALVPQGQSLANCPQIHDELVYDNQGTCGCANFTPTPQQSVTSPNR
ncbi:MAG: hypothetical protein COC12_12975 [Rhodobacteraceae bacterium]|nr:MAG: hypothetical protein COC12_12975 [Paracoccaceae bacterium]